MQSWGITPVGSGTGLTSAVGAVGTLVSGCLQLFGIDTHTTSYGGSTGGSTGGTGGWGSGGHGCVPGRKCT